MRAAAVSGHDVVKGETCGALAAVLARVLVPREHLANAVSLNTLMFQAATILGPALTGILIGAASLGAQDGAALTDAELNAHIGAVYAINAATFVAAIIALALIRYRGSSTPSSNSGIGWKPAPSPFPRGSWIC